MNSGTIVQRRYQVRIGARVPGLLRDSSPCERAFRPRAGPFFCDRDISSLIAHRCDSGTGVSISQTGYARTETTYLFLGQYELPVTFALAPAEDPLVRRLVRAARPSTLGPACRTDVARMTPTRRDDPHHHPWGERPGSCAVPRTRGRRPRCRMRPAFPVDSGSGDRGCRPARWSRDTRHEPAASRPRA
jgi:hypothetical protein